MKVQGCIFDLDGVLVDTAQYHFFAWKRLADELTIPFTIEDNERLKGVSRMQSLEIILEIGHLSLGQKEKQALADKKNQWYRDFLDHMNDEAVLKGALDFVKAVRRHGIKTAVGSASKNAQLVVSRLRMDSLFDSVVDGTLVSRTKPDPEVFVLAAEKLELPTERCLVFEDSAAGIEAAHRCGMKAIGIGRKDRLPQADLLAPSLGELPIEIIFQMK